MYIVIYSFRLKKQQETEFIKAWKDLTIMFRDHADGLGSRLHIKTKQEYIAYAKWPDRNTWENSLSRLPEKSQETRRILRNTCKKIGIVYQLEVVEDFLVKE